MSPLVGYHGIDGVPLFPSSCGHGVIGMEVRGANPAEREGVALHWFLDGRTVLIFNCLNTTLLQILKVITH